MIWWPWLLAAFALGVIVGIALVMAFFIDKVVDKWFQPDDDEA